MKSRHRTSAIVLMLIGLSLYFLYSRKDAVHTAPEASVAEASPSPSEAQVLSTPIVFYERVIDEQRKGVGSVHVRTCTPGTVEVTGFRNPTQGDVNLESVEHW